MVRSSAHWWQAVPMSTAEKRERLGLAMGIASGAMTIATAKERLREIEERYGVPTKEP